MHHGSAVVAVLGLILAACTFHVPVTVTHGDAAVAKCVPLAVGYLLTPDFVAYEQTKTVGGLAQLVFPIGKAAQSAFPDMFAKLFASARAVSGAPGTVPHVQGVDAVIVPRLTESTIEGPGFSGWATTTWWATLGYVFVVYDPAGREIAQWQVEGSGTNFSIDWTGTAGSNNAGAAIAAALSDVENRFLTGFPNDPSIQQWLRIVFTKTYDGAASESDSSHADIAMSKALANSVSQMVNDKDFQAAFFTAQKS